MRSAQSQGIMERLRTATRAAHASIETVPSLRRLLAPDLAVAEYVQTLRRLQAFHAALEPALVRCLTGQSRVAELLDGVGLAALAADIHWFGAIPLPPERRQPAPDCVAAALGAWYVIEGSNLGGRIIGRHVAKSLGVGPGSGGSFYGGRSAQDVQRRWRSLQEVLRLEIDEAGAAWEPVTAAALATFNALETSMRERDDARTATTAEEFPQFAAPLA